MEKKEMEGLREVREGKGRRKWKGESRCADSRDSKSERCRWTEKDEGR